MPAVTYVDADGVEHTVDGEVGQNLMTVAVKLIDPTRPLRDCVRVGV